MRGVQKSLWKPRDAEATGSLNRGGEQTLPPPHHRPEKPPTPPPLDLGLPASGTVRQ